jgi:hypothetical protein
MARRARVAVKAAAVDHRKVRASGAAKPEAGPRYQVWPQGVAPAAPSVMGNLRSSLPVFILSAFALRA